MRRNAKPTTGEWTFAYVDSLHRARSHYVVSITAIANAHNAALAAERERLGDIASEQRRLKEQAIEQLAAEREKSNQKDETLFKAVGEKAKLEAQLAAELEKVVRLMAENREMRAQQEGERSGPE